MPLADAFESIKQRHEKTSISKEIRTIDLDIDDEQLDRQAHGLLADSQLLMHFRTYLFDHERQSDASTGRTNNDRYSVATGGWIQFKSGLYKDWLSFGLTQYGSFKLDGSEKEDGAQLLAPGQQSINVLGEAYIELLHQYGTLKLYRQKINTPFINTNDSRMVPQTFEAVNLFSVNELAVDYILGYVDKMKPRNSDTFEDINYSVENNEAVWMAGLRYRFTPLFRAGMISYHAKDYIDIQYVELDGSYPFVPDTKLKYALQYLQQESIGKEQGGDINTNAWGVRLIYSLYDWQFFLNYTDVDNDHSIISPWGGYPGYNSVQINDFNRAGEEAIGIGAGYNFTNAGIKGLTATIRYIEGNTPDNGDIASSDQSEINYDLQYVFQTGAIEGVSVRLRYADVHRKSYTSWTQGRLKGLDEDQFRLIINYEAKI